MKCNDIINGFEIIRVREIEELDAAIYEMRHIKTGAELVWLKRLDSNKTFSIAFKTLPEDNTGVFHILEHSVLCGSKNYNVKEPFVELLKSSMKTFLNAMTFPDKTVYPISSRNNADFINLMKIYLDAVFNPQIYEKPNIFFQEGWHYELNNEQDEPIYKGVVLNEMKGAYSSVDTVIMAGMNSLLYPDSCYRFESGGNPENITELSYEQFLDAHRKYYHPSNARIFLDGDIQINQVLSIIDSEYLSCYEKKVIDFDITMQKPVQGCEKVQYYEIAPQDDTEGKTQFTMGRVVSSWAEKEKNFALLILCDYLTGSNDSPLKKVLLQKKLGKDVYMQLVDGIAQPNLLLEVRNTDYSMCEQIKSAINEVIRTIVEEGLNKEELMASINRMEFQFREINEPKGIHFCMSALKSWLYGGDPLMYLTCVDTFEALKEKIGMGYFENLLSETLLDDKHMTILCTLPSATVGEENRCRETNNLINAKSSWSKEKLNSIISGNQNLGMWQRTADTEEQLSTLPKLKISDLSLKPEKLLTEVIDINGITVLQHPSKEKGIIYLNLYFSLAELKLEELSAAALHANLIGKLPTTNHDVQTIQRKMKTLLGEFYLDINIFSEYKEYEMCKPYLVVRCSVLEEKVEDAIKLISEVLIDTVFDDENRIREILLQINEGFRQSIIMNGHQYASKRVASHNSAEAIAREYAEGYTCYDWIHNFANNFDEQKDEFIKNAYSLQKNIFTKSHLTLSVTGKASSACLEKLISELPAGEEAMDEASYKKVGQCKEGIAIPAGISYAAMGANLYQCGLEYTGAMKVLTGVLSYGYLWNSVRVQGGAYGAGFIANENGNVGYYSFRDPNAARSLDVYRQTSDYIRSFCESEEELGKFIIGTVADTEPLLSSKNYGITADANYFRGNTYEKQCKLRSEMINTTKEDLLALCHVIDKIVSKDCVCVIGYQDVLNNCEKENLFIMNI